MYLKLFLHCYNLEKGILENKLPSLLASLPFVYKRYGKWICLGINEKNERVGIDIRHLANYVLLLEKRQLSLREEEQFPNNKRKVSVLEDRYGPIYLITTLDLLQEKKIVKRDSEGLYRLLIK